MATRRRSLSASKCWTLIGLVGGSLSVLVLALVAQLCVSSKLVSVSNDDETNFAPPILSSHEPYIQNGHGTNSTLQKLSQMAAAARGNSINKSALPYSCGLIFYYHIPCTGGTTINSFLLEQSTFKS